MDGLRPSCIKQENKMNKIYGLILLLLGVVTDACAQFSSSETVYCYKYDYTSNDGIKSKNSSTTYYFVNFQNNMMGFATARDLKQIRRQMMEDSSYWEDAARNKLADNYRGFKEGKVSYYSPLDMYSGQRVSSVSILKYYPNYSTSSKYTYRWYGREGRMVAGGWGGVTPTPSWDRTEWYNGTCYSFSTDKSEMIIWSTSDSENRDYYKRINMSDLKPNTDFLY